MSRIIENFKSFNSKERFFLVGHILGNASFKPCPAFRESITNALHIQLPESAFAAMDYHLDWLYASLHLAFNHNPEQLIFENKDRLIKGQQEDIDFLFAYEADDISHIILLEAKGVGGFTNKQIGSKADRFREIFGMDGKRWPGVKPHFAFVSPDRPSERLQSSAWPIWMKPNSVVPWIELPIPSGLKKVTRCNQRGKPDKEGQYWTISGRQAPNTRAIGMYELANEGGSQQSGGPGRNYCGRLPLTEMIQKCQQVGSRIVVGYVGGAPKLTLTTFESLRSRRFKWDWVDNPIGSKEDRNWILGSRFLELITLKLPADEHNKWDTVTCDDHEPSDGTVLVETIT